MRSSKILHFSHLLYVLILAIAIAPIIEDFAYLNIAFDLVFSLIFVLGCFIVSQRKFLPWLEVILAIPMLLSVWTRHFDLNVPFLTSIGTFSGILFFTLMAWVILSYVFSCREVTWEVISAALVVYLLIGATWGLGYAFIESVQPESFRGAENLVKKGSNGFIYYSFITLTTVGYGDITPISGIARALSLLEGIIGQSYMAVLVARLVGMQVAASSMKLPDE